MTNTMPVTKSIWKEDLYINKEEEGENEKEDYERVVEGQGGEKNVRG